MPDDTNSRPLVLQLECPELRDSLRDHGLDSLAVPDLGALLEPEAGLDARAILLSSRIFDDAALRDTVVALRRTWPLVDVLIWARQAKADFVREALRAGARDVLLTESPDICAGAVAKVIEDQRLLPRATRLGDSEDGGEQPSIFEGMVGRSPAMWDLFDVATRVATTDASVLLLGETGTGKELLARAIHKHSGRQGRFVAVNCAAVTEELINSELFGHAKGAFTGAEREKEGLFRHADGGTLLLDEIGNIPLPVQYRLLRVLQEGTIRPVGENHEVAVDTRIIAATSTALEEAVQHGDFRDDLFFRLDVIRLEIPPLRDRPEDIIFLFGHFTRRFARHYEVPRPEVSDGFLDALVGYDWPGNVRQLENVTERLTLVRDSHRLTAEDLDAVLPFDGRGDANQGRHRRAAAAAAASPQLDLSKPMKEALEPEIDALERRYLEACLRETGGRVGAAAERAGIGRRTLLRKLKRLGIDKNDFKQGPVADATDPAA